MKNGRQHKATPEGVRAYAQMRWGPFDTDMAAEVRNTMADVWFSEGNQFQDYEGTFPLGVLWANPPWEKTPGIGAFVDHWIRNRNHSELTVWLLPTRTGQQWYSDLMTVCAQVPIRGRLHFAPPPGQPKGGGGFEDCAFFVHRDPTLAAGRVYPGPKASKGDIR